MPMKGIIAQFLENEEKKRQPGKTEEGTLTVFNHGVQDTMKTIISWISEKYMKK